MAQFDPLLSGTAAQLALGYLKSGRLLKEGGLESLQKAYRATNRNEDLPEEAVSEFRKILNAIKADEAANVVYGARTGNVGNSIRDLMGELPDNRLTSAIDSSLNNSQTWSTRADKYKQEFIDNPRSYKASDVQMTPKEAMQNFRYASTRSRAQAEVLSALVRLLGEQL